jgi:hypothetical protein
MVDGTSRNAYSLLNDYLNDLTTSYYANKILEWIESKVAIDNNSQYTLNTMKRIDKELGIKF